MAQVSSEHDIRAITRLFDLRADYVSSETYGSGHINDTYCVRCDQAGLPVRFVLQRINHRVFHDPVLLMENVDRVTKHALAVLIAEGSEEAHRRTLTCIPAWDGRPYVVDGEGSCWRVYPFIERAFSYDQAATNAQAYHAARAFGEFQKLTASLSGPRLHESIPRFHDTPERLAVLESAITADAAGRAEEVSTEIAFVRERAADCSLIIDLIASRKIPERISHNDTKLNNVLLDEVTDEGVCVIDLDTTMPGSSLHDFGDMVRSITPGEAEDGSGRPGVTLDRFDALVHGYISAATFLNDQERKHLVQAGRLMTLECGIRFLSDYLQGDVYFKIKRPSHNLDRCRSQFALVSSIEQHFEEMETIVRRY